MVRVEVVMVMVEEVEEEVVGVVVMPREVSRDAGIGERSLDVRRESKRAFAQSEGTHMLSRRGSSDVLLEVVVVVEMLVLLAVEEVEEMVVVVMAEEVEEVLLL